MSLVFKIFGSRATGNHRSDSDIDVLMEGSVWSIVYAKEALFCFSVEQGGPLDLFVLGSVDNEIDLVSAYEGDSRLVALGDEDDLAKAMSSAIVIDFAALVQLCEKVEPGWHETSSREKSKRKSNRP